MSKEDVKSNSSYLKIFLNPEEIYSIGTHVCGLRNEIENINELADSIFENGLMFKTFEGVGLTGTVYMKGSTDFEEKIDKSVEELYEQVDNNVIPAGVIVAVPGSIQGIDGKDYYLGTYPDDLEWIAKDDKRLSFLPIEDFVRKIGRVPREFILGILIKDYDQTICIGNSNYISYLDKEKQAEILEEFRLQGLETDEIDRLKFFPEKIARTLGKDYYKGTKYLSESCIKYEIDREVQRKKFADWQRSFETEENHLKEMLEETEQEEKIEFTDRLKK